VTTNELEEIVGQRVVLRELTRDDVDEMARWPRFVEPELQWANLELNSARDRDGWFERSRSNLTRRRFTIWATEHLHAADARRGEPGALRAGGAPAQRREGRGARCIGTIGLRNIDFRYGEGTLGVIVNAADVGRGYGTDAIKALVRYAFENLGLRKVYLDVADGNDRAMRCYERVGFSRIGQHRGTEGVLYVDMVLTRERYEAHRRVSS
jgi:RimJ/RimL family protein N-acetyltransferase